MLRILLALLAALAAPAVSAQSGAGELARCQNADPLATGRYTGDVRCPGTPPPDPSATVTLPSTTIPALPSSMTPPHCAAGQKVQGTGCVSICPAHQRWSGSACVARCTGTNYRWSTSAQRCVRFRCPAPPYPSVLYPGIGGHCYCPCGQYRYEDPIRHRWFCFSSCPAGQIWRPYTALSGRVGSCGGRCECISGTWNGYECLAGEGWGDG